MVLQARRLERARALLDETLRAHPAGLPGIVLVDHLQRWGFPEEEGLALIRRLQDDGELRVDRGHYKL